MSRLFPYHNPCLPANYSRFYLLTELIDEQTLFVDKLAQIAYNKNFL